MGDFMGALLSGGPFEWGPLTGALLCGAPLGGGPLSGAPLSGSLHLHEGSLLEVSHTRTVAFLSGSQLMWGPPWVRAPLSGGLSVGAPLSGGHLEWAPLSGASLSRASLSGAPLSGAPLIGAPLSESPLDLGHLVWGSLERGPPCVGAP
jgi:uncharacterized protein YjbI with pentapeptide repeats